MKHGFIILCLASIFAFGACSEEDHSLDCDVATYQAKCLNASSYMWCNSGQLIRTECSQQSYCSERANEPATCVPKK
ncbi:MAG: hypothetical protein IJU23_12705 [Proteobacteria bacterium]|nr:hypothetical protein [Pseudomonadota bacterium]